MSIISKVKLPNITTPYDIGVNWENVKDKPSVGGVDVSVSSEDLKIKTNNNILLENAEEVSF